jgi:type II secretory pathway pseudopilin PulG
MSNPRIPRGASPAEILLALMVLGILVFIGVVQIRSERARTRDALRIADMSQLASAFRALAAVEGSYQAAGATCTVGDPVAKCELSTYLPSVSHLVDPLGAPYTVSKKPGPDGFAVEFTLERGAPGFVRGAHVLTEKGIR